MTLKPCPFCGAPAELGGKKTTYVQCTRCTAVVFQKLRDGMSAIRRWNRRRSAVTQEGKP